VTGGDPSAVAGRPSRDAARAHLEALAGAARPAGGAAEARARDHCARTLRALGYAVAERPFEYSALPGRFGTPLGGVVSIIALTVAGHVGYNGAPGTSLAVLVGAAAALLAGGAWMARRGVLTAPLLRARGVNLEARRGAGEPRLWLVAHLDSKSQPVSIAVRALGVSLSIVAWCAALVLAALQLAGRAGGAAWPSVSLLGMVAGLPVALSVVGSRSPGALDNASGVATVLLTAATLPPSAPVGVLLTSAEELGLAGARAWVAARGARGGVALNCDGVDDDGRVMCMYTRRPPRRLLDAVARAARALGAPDPRPRRLLPGILTDGVALADGGWEAITVSRGNVRTLLRIHGRRDSLAALDGRGVAETGALLAEAATALLL